MSCIYLLNKAHNDYCVFALLARSAADSPSKYLRIGPAPKALGNSVAVNNSWWGDADYPGVDEFSNFAGLLQAIGYCKEGRSRRGWKTWQLR
jgi:hypothetical protein